jgi:hypothetical protein
MVQLSLEVQTRRSIMTLMLHDGAEEVPFEQLRQLATPVATPTHVPIAHHDIVDKVKYALTYYGHEVTEEHHGVTEDGNRYFGLLSLRSTYGGYEDTVGLRNSHDKKFPIGISFGSRVFVCDNLAFIGDHVIKRRHTANAKRDLVSHIQAHIEPLAIEREKQHLCFERYKDTGLPDELADHAILELYRRGVINVQRIAEVMSGWENPPYEEWGDRTAWRLFNATTAALEGRVIEQGGATSKLHQVINGVCEVVH